MERDEGLKTLEIIHTELCTFLLTVLEDVFSSSFEKFVLALEKLRKSHE